MKIKFLLLSFFFFPSIIFGKEIIYKIYTSQLKITTPDYHIEKVIDARDEKYAIGFVQKGITKKRRLAIFEEGLEKEFSLLFEKNMPVTDVSSAYVLRVNKFFIYEISYLSNELALVDVNFTIIQKVGDEYFEIFESGNTQERGGGGFDATTFHVKNMIKGISKIFKDFKRYKKEGNLYRKKITEEDLYKNSLDRKDFPILEKGIIPKGAFYSYTDFKECLPDTSANFSIKQITFNNYEEGKLIWKNAEEEEVTRPYHVWGVSDGKDIYMNINNRFFKIERKGNDFLVKANIINNDTYYRLNIGIGVIVGGAVGGIIMAEIGTNGRSKGPGRINVELFLDWTTGNASSKNNDVYFDVTSKVILFSHFYGQGKKNIDLYKDGKHLCTIFPNQYYEFEIPPEEKNKIELCVECDGQKKCQTLQPKHFSETYYNISISKKGKLNLEKMIEAGIELVEKRIENKMAERVCEPDEIN